ncbi:hypothetical protein GE09DRAFT_946916 [Coniochaeta sp. 2T2.1]|nr:hypothetical protein GE09DRAFT_946916 [Coniochaeta sp. 2T2.1]
MAESSSASNFAAQLKAKHAEAAGHHVEVEEVPDEDIMSHHANTAASGTEANPSWAEPSTKPAPKQETKPLDTQSHDLFPELGGQSKGKSPAGVVPVWSAKSATNGKANGASATNGTPRTSAPASGVSTPTGTGQHAAPSLSIPGRNVETLFLEPQHMQPKTQLRKPLGDILKDLNRKSRAQISMSTLGNGRLKFEAAGPQDIAAQALKELVQQIGTKQTVKVPIPQSARAHIIGKGGSTIKSLQEKSGARIQLPKADEGQPVDDDDDATIDVMVEGNAHSAAIARDLILKIAGERAANVSTKVRGVPAEFYPFIAGPKNSFVHNLEENNGVQVRIPPHQAWGAQPAPRVVGQRPVFAPAANDNHIQLAGERAAVQAARAEIERRAAELQRQLQLEQLNIQRGRHQFIIGNRGVDETEFFEETGCVIILPTDEEDDTVTVIGPPENIQGGLEKAMDLATSMQCSNIDISRFHRQAPGGGAAHARNVTRYLRERNEIERLEKEYNVHFNTPFTSEGAQPWELYSRDGKAAIRAQSEIKGIVDSHPPARISTVPVDSFFYQYLRSEINPRVHDQYGVHLVVPNSNDSDVPVLLVYEGPSPQDTPYQIPRSQPSQADIRNFEKGLREARQHIEDLIKQQESLTSVSIDVPHKYHEKLKKFIKNEQDERRAADQIPVRVSSLRETVNFRGPTSAVESLAEKCRAFVEQEKEDEKERGFTLDFDFPQKFANHLIGKGGSHIKEMKEKFDVEIQVQDGKVQLKGPQKKTEAAKAHIVSLGKQLADETTHVLKIDPKFHRELIGAGGGQINRLQTRYKVQIFFPRSGKNAKDDESVVDGASEAGKPKRQQAPDEVIVRGPKKGADEARDEILSLLQYLKDNSFTATVSVQQKQLPSLIGQGGSGMEQLRQATGARIDIPNGRDIPEGTLVEITIKGTKEQVAAAKKLLEEKRAVFDDTVVKTLEVDKTYHKALIGAGGANLRDIVLKAGGSDDRRELARTIQFPKQDSEGNTIKVEGRTDIVDKIVAHIQDFVSQRENQVTEVVDVPTEKHRSLIGRGGDVKRGLESQFKVSLDIPRQGSGQTGVKIVGQAPDVEKAKEHLLGLIKEQAGETVQVPRKLHHAVSNNGQFFRRLRSDHHVTVDHAGHSIPEKPAAPAPSARTGALPLITDDEESTSDVHSWTIVEAVSTEEGDIPWVLRGSPDNVEKAKKAIENALKQAAGQNATGYLVLPDPRTYRHVIGQGGSKVNAIRKQSGCKITVPRDQAGDAIEIVGSREGVEKAKELILAAVKEGVNGRQAME